MILLGGGGHAAVVAEAARAAGYIVEGYLDDVPPLPEAPPDPVVGFRHLGAIRDLRKVMDSHRHANFHAAIGDPQLRKVWLQSTTPRLTPPIIHPSAIVSPSATIAEGAFVGPLAVINARAIIGMGAIVNTGAIVEHDCILSEFCHIAPGCVLAGSVKIGQGTLVGAGCTIIPGVRIGDRVTLGAGAVAIADIPDEVTAAGVPARIMNAVG